MNNQRPKAHSVATTKEHDKNNPMNINKLLSPLNLRRAAFHEAGHAIVGRHLGYIWLSITIDAIGGGLTCQIKHNDTPDERGIRAWAGCLAEPFADGDVQSVEEWVHYAEANHGFSADYLNLDAELMSWCSNGFGDYEQIDACNDVSGCFNKALEILIAKRKELEQLAVQLLDNRSMGANGPLLAAETQFWRQFWTNDKERKAVWDAAHNPVSALGGNIRPTGFHVPQVVSQNLTE